MQQITKISDLKTGTFYSENEETFICFDLKKGETEIVF